MSTVVASAWAGTFDGVLALQSDKVIRGTSLSGGDAVLSADGSWRSDDGTLSLVSGLSSMGRDRSRGDAESTLGAGLGGSISDDMGWRAGVTRYDVLGHGINRRPAYLEWSGSLGWQGRLQVMLAWAPAYPLVLPDAGVMRGQGLFAEATWHQALVAGWTLDAGLGHAGYRSMAITDYRYCSISLGWRHQGLQVVVTRVFSTSLSPTVRGPRPVLSLLWSL